jgi:hypothetical protein
MGQIYETKAAETPFQADPVAAWRNMGLYWAVGALVLVMGGVDTREGIPKQAFRGTLRLAAAFVTVMVQPLLLSRFGTYGRPRCWPAIIVFSALNGTLETALFLAAYNVGKALEGEVLPYELSVTAGFCVYCLYSAIIHARFWLPCAFPRHVLETAQPFHTRMLPALMLMSTAWITIYEVSQDVPFICLLHTLTDVLVAMRMNLPPPWKSRISLD